MAVFDEWLSNYEKNNLSKENRAYLPLASIKTLLPLKKQYKLDDITSNAFLKAYRKCDGEYKNLRTIASGSDAATWDIVRNAALKKLLRNVDETKAELWKDDLPTKEHMELILWAYSPDASKIKKNLGKYEEKLGSDAESADEEDEKKDESMDDEVDAKKGSKRKSDDDDVSSSSEEDSPKKKKKSE